MWRLNLMTCADKLTIGQGIIGPLPQDPYATTPPIGRTQIPAHLIDLQMGSWKRPTSWEENMAYMKSNMEEMGFFPKANAKTDAISSVKKVRLAVILRLCFYVLIYFSRAFAAEPEQRERCH